VVSCGLYWDLFSVLVVMPPKQQTGKDRTDETHPSDRTKSTPKENDLAAAMSHDRPKVLFGKSGGTGKLVLLEDGFRACPTHAKWIGGSESYKAKLSKMLVNTYLLGVSGSLPPMGGGPAAVFAREVVVEIRSQWTDVVTFIDSFMLELCEVAKFPKAKAWALVGRCLAAVFDCMASHRAKIAHLRDPTTLETKAAYLWGVLQCHRVMQKFILVQFRSHPAIVKEMSLFMISEQVDPSELEGMRGRLKKTEDAHAASLSAVARLLEASNATLKRNYNNLLNNVKLLKMKVK
jgi:hypothetical protein